MALKDTDTIEAEAAYDVLNELVCAQMGVDTFYGPSAAYAMQMLQDILEIDETER